MYLRHTTRKKDGKVHRYWSLVRSVRVGRRVIQQTVAHLGELDEQGRLEMWQSRAGLGNSPRTILEELARIQSHDVVLPTAAHGQIRLRCVHPQEPALAALLDRLGIVLPKRMRLPEQELISLPRSA